MIVEQGARLLENAGIDEPVANSEFLLSFVLKRPRLELRLDSQADSAQTSEFFRLVLRRSSGEPLSYITGEQDFFGMKFFVSPQVLIPRPETEGLVETALPLISEKASVLDLCAGSGCIACAVARERPLSPVTASDVSAEAVSIARRNAETLGLAGRINFVVSDLFASIGGKFDAIISNPPYVPAARLDSLPSDVRREPRLALDGGEAGLEIIKRIAAQAAGYLNPGGIIALEIDSGQRDEVLKLFSGWRNAEVLKDFAGLPRYLIAGENGQVRN